jgi:ligand-binding sensor domain-containing protein
VGTAFDGVRRLDLAGEIATLADWRLRREEGLPDSAVRALAHWQGDLWVGTGRSVSRLRGDRLVVYDERNGFPRSGVFSFAAARDGNGRPCLWAAQFGAGLARFAADGAWTRFGSEDGLPEDYLLSLLVTDANGARPLLWAGTGSSGVVRQERGRWRAWAERSGLPHRSVVGLGEVREPDGEEVLWAGSLGGAARWARGRWQPWLRELLGDRVLYDAANHDGATWLATSRGLLRWDGDGARWLTSDDTALPGLSLSDLQTRRGPGGRPELWVTTNHGVARLTGDAIAAFDTGQPFNGPRSLAAGATGPGGEQELWLAAGNGVFRLRGESWEPLPPSCVPATEAIHVLWQAESGVAWVAHRHGLTRVGADGRCHTLARGEGIHPPLYQLALDRHGFLYGFCLLGELRIPY